jgi:hypothetical protein
MRNVPAHYIRANEQARIPARYVILDTESLREKDEKGEVQTWALSVATFLEWTKKGNVVSSTSRFDTPTELWQAVSCFTRKGRRTVLYAHNLNFDLRISQALSTLPRMDWSLRDMRIDGRGSWSKWSRDKATLTLCDSASIFPIKLAELAPMFGMVKPPLPTSTDREALFARCTADVNILTAAVVSYVTWLRTGQCGNWRMTGASQSWSHWRHSHYTTRVLVHDDAEAIRAERAAMHSGRCEAYRWGSQTNGPFWEYDWQNSYPRIARDCLLPSQLHGTVANPSPASVGKLLERYCVLAELEVTTESECVPASYDGRVVWPVGSFRTTLWDSEIRLLQESGATFRVHRAWLYKRGPVLKDWAEWILSSLHDPSDAIEPWKKLILKHWSRALIGRFGMRYSPWEKYGQSTDNRIYLSQQYDLDTGSMTELMQIGTDIFMSGELREIDDGCPQITSYVMSEARARLWRARQSIRPENVLYVDTDSLLVNAHGHQRIQANSSDTLFDGLRSKGRYRTVHLYGPRTILLENKPVVSGMPKSSARRYDGTYVGETWRSGKQSIHMGEPSTVRITYRNFTLQYNQARRQFNADGTTSPYRLPRDAPIGIIPFRQWEKQRLNDIGYPALLTHSAPKTNATGPV